MTKGIVIGYDGKRAVQNMTGLGNYSRVVVGTMSAMYPDNEYVLMAPRMRENPRLEPLLMRENVRVVTPATAIGRALPWWWRSVAMTSQMAELGLDLYHGLSNEIPLSAGMAPCATVVTVHDLIWRKFPQDYSAPDRRLYEWKYGRSARLATRVIAISERTRRDMMELWGIDPDKIDVIRQGCDPIFSRPVTYEDRERCRSRYSLPQRYILSVGTLQWRKNQLLAVKALSALPPDVRLVLVGGGRADYIAEIERCIAAEGLGDRVVRLQNVPFDDLPALYALSVFASYTSRYEGFGLPLLEAASTGTPSIACTGSCLDEAGGEGAVYVDPDDVRGYVQAALKLLDEPSFHTRLANRGKRHAARFTPDAFACETMKTYNKAILDFSLKGLK